MDVVKSLAAAAAAVELQRTPLGPGINLQRREGGREGEKTHTLRWNKDMRRLDPGRGGSRPVHMSLKQRSFEPRRLCVTSRVLRLF